MNNLFQRTSSHWVKCSKYEMKEAAEGARYIKPAPKAKPIVYDLLKDAEALQKIKHDGTYLATGIHDL